MAKDRQDDLESRMTQMQKNMEALMKDNSERKEEIREFKKNIEELLLETEMESLRMVGKKIQTLSLTEVKLTKNLQDKSSEIIELKDIIKEKDKRICALEQENKQLSEHGPVVCVSTDAKVAVLKSGVSDMKQFFSSKDSTSNLESLWCVFTEISKEIKKAEKNNREPELSAAESEFLKQFAIMFSAIKKYSELEAIDSKKITTQENQENLAEKRKIEKKHFKSSLSGNDYSLMQPAINKLIDLVTSEKKEELLRQYEPVPSWCPIL